jgi:hypothetical protein
MAWARDAQRLAEDGYMVIVFDELTTVPPTTQAAMLRLLTENVCGELALPNYEPGKGGVVYLCASNAVEWPPADRRFSRRWRTACGTAKPSTDHETWCDMMLNDFPAPRICRPADYLHAHHQQRAMIAAYVKAAGRDAWMAPPDDPARRSGPWPSGRTWYLASRLLAAIEAASPGNRLPGDRHSPASWATRHCRSSAPETLNLPIRDILGSAPVRAARSRRSRLCDLLFARRRRHQSQHPDDGSGDDCPGAASRKNADIPAAAARTLCDKRNRQKA